MHYAGPMGFYGSPERKRTEAVLRLQRRIGQAGFRLEEHQEDQNLADAVWHLDNALDGDRASVTLAQKALARSADVG